MRRTSPIISWHVDDAIRSKACSRLGVVLSLWRQRDRLQALQVLLAEEMLCIRTPTSDRACERFPSFANIVCHLPPDVRQVQKQTPFAVGRYRFGYVTTVLFVSQVLLSARHENLPLEFIDVTNLRRKTRAQSAIRKHAGGTG
jgi:hypothetical protein